MKRLIRILDLETSGLDPRVDRICEVATIDVHVDNLAEESDAQLVFERGGMFSTLVDRKCRYRSRRVARMTS